MNSDADNQILMAARLLPKFGNIFIGVGTPLFVGLVAKQLSPAISAHVEAAAIGLNPDASFGTIGDVALVKRAENLVPISEFFNYWVKKVPYSCTVLRALEVDEQGTLNTCKTGSSSLGGLGGAIVGAQCSPEVVVLTSTMQRGLVKKVMHATHPLGSLSQGRSQIVHLVTENAVFTRGVGDSTFQCTAISAGDLAEEAVFQGWSISGMGPALTFNADEYAALEAAKRLFRQH